ncbi:MAG: sulfatase [Anaerolineae bacterium]|nr:sulfatase [Anaerolineae bacterium]
MSTNQPNIIYIFADQLRYQSCGFAGDPKAQTPHIDQFALEGVNFVNCVSGHPMCAPYRASLFTGKYTSSTGMVINELRMNPNHRAFGHVLHEGGYDTYYIGKWHLWANELGNHDDPKNSYTPPGPYRLGFDGYWASYGFHHTYWDQYYHTDSPEKIVIPGYEPDGQTDLAIQKLKEAASSEKPFALFLSLGTPHDPWREDCIPAEYLEKFKDTPFELPPNYKRENDPHADNWARLSAEERSELTEWMRVYYAMTANLDWNVGRLLAAIETLQLHNNTIVVFTSDHGEMFGAQGRHAKNIFYEEAVRVPFLIRWPEHIPANYVSDACLNTPDIMPTLLSLMGLPVPPEVEGDDLSHCALGAQGPESEAAFMQGMGATAIFEDGHEWRALRDKQYTYAIYRSDRSEYLFDNLADPYQQHNLAHKSEYQPRIEYYRQMLQQRMAKLNDSFEACTWYQDNWINDRHILHTATLS